MPWPKMSTRRRVCVLGAGLALAAGISGTSAAGDRADDRGPGAGRADGGARPVVAAGGNVRPADIEDVEHMCALLTACDGLPLPPGIVPRDFVGCTRALYPELASARAISFSLTLRECGLTASSCNELRTCALRGAKADVCHGRGKTGSVDMCDGAGRAITCTNEHVTLVRDCPRGGEQCVISGGHAVCALGSCGKDAPAACSRSGTRVLECKKGKLLSLDCGAFGLRCTAAADGPKCATEAAQCTPGSTRCDGQTAIACRHGHEVRVDCGARGLLCGGGTASRDNSGAKLTAVGECAVRRPAKGACDPSAPPRCDGATLKWCAYGHPRAYLCKSVGLQHCISSAKTGARCAP